MRQRFDLKAIMELAKDSGKANPLIFLAAPDGSTGSNVIGSISIRDLAAAIRSDSGSIKLQTKNDKVMLDTCTAVMEIMEMFMNPATVEMLRKEWRESIISKPDHHGRPGMPQYGGLVKNDKGIGRKGSG